ncbi:MAG: arginine--tRNA ligase [Clostridia bacterium]|nr:arginine--tRNA ligase [Clostridia bacterium]MBQ8371734.1 arginine--tRNA ligase [Clostridia bacterium]
MLVLKKKTAGLLADCVAKKFGEGLLGAEEIFSMLEYPPDRTMGDLALPCFRLSKTLRRSPVQIAEALADGFDCEEFSSVSAVNGYLNFKISPTAFTARVVSDVVRMGDKYGSPMNGEGKTVVLDYSSPNVAKPFHIGHLGTTVIGHSLKLLHEFAGYKCVGINYLGDWGTQFGKLIVAYKLWGDKATVEQGGVDELVKLYVRINNEIKAEEDASVAGKPEGTPKHSALADSSRAEFAKMENGDEENLALWRWFVSVSLEEYQKTYKLLGIEFDSYKGESFYTDKMPAQVEKLRNMGLLEIDDGASIVNLDKWNMPVCLILKRDGTTLYPTRDIAAAVYRYGEYGFDKAIYVTAAQQSLHFAQWFKVVELMGYDWYDKLVHVPYGMVSIGGAKLATRTGNVILLRDLFDEAISRVAEITREKHPDEDECRAIAEKVGVGAVIFYYLSNNRMRDINFSMEDALSFDGNTGPYVQYTYARTCSVLEKAAGEQGVITDAPLSEVEFELAKCISVFPERVSAAIAEYEPSVVTRYILDLAAAFNRFYHECKIVGCEDAALRQSRIALTAATNRVLKTALHLICMQSPEKI